MDFSGAVFVQNQNRTATLAADDNSFCEHTVIPVRCRAPVSHDTVLQGPVHLRGKVPAEHD